MRDVLARFARGEIYFAAANDAQVHKRVLDDMATMNEALARWSLGAFP
jgi:hypothetical protein